MGVDRYQKIEAWARKRYIVDGLLIIFKNGKPSRYSILEDLAFQKYLKHQQESVP